MRRFYRAATARDLILRKSVKKLRLRNVTDECAAGMAEMPLLLDILKLFMPVIDRKVSTFAGRNRFALLSVLFFGGKSGNVEGAPVNYAWACFLAAGRMNALPDRFSIEYPYDARAIVFLAWREAAMERLGFNLRTVSPGRASAIGFEDARA